MATYYIDPSTTTNGSGALASPYNTWSGVTLTANNTYLQKRGTTYVGASVRPASQSSAAATPLTIGAYYNADGTDDTSKPKPVIDHNGGTNGVGAVFVDTCANVVVRDIDGRNSRGSFGAGVTIRRSQNVRVQRCIGRDSEHGVCIYQDEASATSTCTDITIDDCDTYDNVSGGITMRYGSPATAVLKRVKITGNRVRRNGLGKGVGAGGSSVPAGGIMSYTAQKSLVDVDRRSYDLTMTGNEVYANNGYGINVEMFDNDTITSTISHNNVYGNGASLDIDSHSLWIGNCFGVVVEHNYVHDNFAYANYSTGSGVGIFVDYNGVSATGGERCVVRGNVVARQYGGGTTAITPSAAIMVLNNATTRVESNVSVGCRQGIVIGPAGTDGTLVRNNALLDCTEFGICNHGSGTTNTTVQNNIVSGAAVGIFAATAGAAGFAESNNDVHDCTVPRANGTYSSPTGTSLAATDITTDPLFVDPSKPWLGLKPGSPCQSAGAYIQGAKDRFGRRYINPPNIGPWAVIPRG